MKSVCPLQIDFLGIKLYIVLGIVIITIVALDLKIYKRKIKKRKDIIFFSKN